MFQADETHEKEVVRIDFSYFVFCSFPTSYGGRLCILSAGIISNAGLLCSYLLQMEMLPPGGKWEDAVTTETQETHETHQQALWRVLRGVNSGGVETGQQP